MSASGAGTPDGGPGIEVAAAVADIGIPPCPRVLGEFMQQLARDEPDPRKMASLILSDVGLASAVLKMANSAFYGPRAHAESVHAALNFLGMRTCANLIAGLLMHRAFASIGDPAMNVFWESSSRCGNALAFLGPALAVAPVAEAHTFGLFRNCGVPLLLRRFFDYGEVFLEDHARGIRDIASLERARYGVDHATLGARMARDWHLSELVHGAIGLHHFDVPDPETPVQADATVKQQVRLLAAAGVIGECFERLLRTPQLPDVWTERLERAGAVLSLGMRDLEALRGPVARAIEQGPDLFGTGASA